MNTYDFTKFISDSNRVLAIDFDGVLHNDFKGFHDGTIYGSIIEGSEEALKILSQSYTIIIYSCKSNPKRPLINNKTGTELIWEWLENNNIKQYVKDVVFGKPNAFLYIDDKGYRFNNWNDTLNDIKKIENEFTN